MTGRIIIADDHPMFREAMLRTVQRLLPDAVVQETGDLDGVFALIREGGDSSAVYVVMPMRV